MRLDREEATQRLIEHCVKKGTFTLTSGRQSDFYLDIKKALMDSKLCDFITSYIVQRVIRGPGRFNGVAGVELGACPLVTGVSLEFFRMGRVSRSKALYIRKKPKDHGTGGQIEGLDLTSPGEEFILLEDVLTSGGSAFKGVNVLRAAGLVCNRVMAVVDRQEGAEMLLDHGLTVESIWTRSELMG